MTAVSRRLNSSLLFEFTRIIVAIPTVAKVKGTNVSISMIPGNSSGIAETDTISNEETEIFETSRHSEIRNSKDPAYTGANAAVSGRSGFAGTRHSPCFRLPKPRPLGKVPLKRPKWLKLARVPS